MAHCALRGPRRVADTVTPSRTLATALSWGRLAEWHGYRDGVGEPASSARMLGRPARGLQVPHRRAEAVERVAGRESVAVPYDVREGSGVSSVLAAAASA